MEQDKIGQLKGGSLLNGELTSREENPGGIFNLVSAMTGGCPYWSPLPWLSQTWVFPGALSLEVVFHWPMKPQSNGVFLFDNCSRGVCSSLVVHEALK